MKMMIVVLLALVALSLIAPNAFAYRLGSHPSEDSSYSPDDNGRLTRNDNMYKDSDGDGVINKFDHNDRNSSIQ